MDTGYWFQRVGIELESFEAIFQCFQKSSIASIVLLAGLAHHGVWESAAAAVDLFYCSAWHARQSNIVVFSIQGLAAQVQTTKKRSYAKKAHPLTHALFASGQIRVCLICVVCHRAGRIVISEHCNL